MYSCNEGQEGGSFASCRSGIRLGICRHIRQRAGRPPIWSSAAIIWSTAFSLAATAIRQKDRAGDIGDKAFSGGLSWDEPPFKVTAPNITPDKETGIGNYNDAELKEVLRKGTQWRASRDDHAKRILRNHERS